jgi:hypothetical protein
MLYVFIVGSNAGQALTCLFLFISWVPTPFACFPLSPASSRRLVPSRFNHSLPSALRSFPHGEGISVPEPAKECTIHSEAEDKGKSTSGTSEPPASIEPRGSHGRSSAPQPHILTQDKLNDLVRDLGLSNSKAELLGSILKQWNLLEKNVRFFSFRSRHQQLAPFFRKEDDFLLCYDVDGLMKALGIKHDHKKSD